MNTETAFDPTNRELCADGSCLGVVMSGNCNLCGLASASDSPRDPGSGGEKPAPRDPGSGGEKPGGSGDHGSGDGADKPAAPRDPGSGGVSMMAMADHDAFESRQLCVDGACTGLVGHDGKCKECGRSAAS